ncbi:MAG: acyl-CoA thioesterase [Scytolyngbya sp. HA4215-MV1]|jgi:1,4-dihydroxy-2-naphthoyl-CoA hydrolase|nr:acyl-CoA thioesterase [Scytolyngbya sp. HA4215-MV1]
MPFLYDRIIHFNDTDAAGVVYFANLLTICHEAYEASLMASRIDLKTFFRNSEIAIPIVHASVNFFRPLVCGDRITLHLTPQLFTESKFEISYQVFLSTTETLAGNALTRHVCIQPASRSKVSLSAQMEGWLRQWNGEGEGVEEWRDEEGKGGGVEG